MCSGADKFGNDNENLVEVTKLKSGIHPEYKELEMTCACGAKYANRSTRDKISVEICANCHPFFTGKQKLIDTAGRVERFRRKYGNLEKKK